MHTETVGESPLTNSLLVSFPQSWVYSMLHYKIMQPCIFLSTSGYAMRPLGTHCFKNNYKPSRDLREASLLGKNTIGSAVSEILWYKQKDRQTNKQTDILLLYFKN